MEEDSNYSNYLGEDLYYIGLEEYEGYSLKDLDDMATNPFGPDSPVLINKLSEQEYLEIPILSQIRYLLHIIDRDNELKLTQKGNLPVKVVKELYEQGFLKDYWIENGYSKSFLEDRLPHVTIARILALKAGLVKKRNNKLSLTTRALKVMNNNEQFFEVIHEAFTKKYDWATLDSFPDKYVGQWGFVYNLILLKKYGHEPQSDQFYAEKYFLAYDEPLGPPADSFILINGAYSYRTFDNFMTYYGLAQVTRETNLEPKMIQATPLFLKLITVHPSKT